jgi:1-acyl-sn-glycerol-3-phosphate acyltransferase
MKAFARFLIKLFGWKAVGTFPYEHKKLVILVAPHTSNLDYFIGMMFIYAAGEKVNVIMKKEAFFWPIGGLLKKMGAVPIDRSKSTRKTESIAKLFDKYEKLYLVIAPEGTRSYTDKWKKGYYYIALQAKVPIMLTSIDYKKKEGRYGPVIYPSGDFEKDFEKVKEFYKGVGARFPKKYNLSDIYLKEQ